MSVKETQEMMEAYLIERYSFRKNIITGEVEIRSKQLADSDWQSFDVFTILRDLKLNNHRVTLADLENLVRSDFVPEYDPFESYFIGLEPWDDSDLDFIGLLLKFIKVKDQNRFERHFKKWMVRAVKCGLEDDYINKQLIILVGEKQNTGKSSFIRFLIPRDLIAYLVENIGTDKDSLIALIENLLVNMDELETFSKYELNALKSIISKTFVKIRHPYDRKAKNLPRRASFIGSTNEIEFLSDITGNVRWIPFEVLSIDWTYRDKVDIDKVWAQAYSLYKKGFPCDITAEEMRENEEAAKHYSIVTLEMEILSKFFIPGTKEDYDLFLTTTELEMELRSLTSGAVRVSNQLLGRALRALRFVRGNRYVPGLPFPYKAYYIKYLRK